MKKWQSLAAMLAVILLVNSLQAQEQQTRREGRGRGGQGVQTLALPPNLELTEDQTAKVEKIREKYQKEAQELQQKQNQVLTAEQRKARTEAMQAAREAGKTQAEIREITRSLQDQLTDDQKQKMQSLREESQKVRQKFMAEVTEVLTDEQKAKLREGRRGQGGRPQSPRRRSSSDN